MEKSDNRRECIEALQKIDLPPIMFDPKKIDGISREDLLKKWEISEELKRMIESCNRTDSDNGI